MPPRAIRRVMSKRRIVVFDKSSSAIAIGLSYWNDLLELAIRCARELNRGYHVAMIKTLSPIALTLAGLLALSYSVRAQEAPNSEEASRVRESITVLNEVMSTSDTSIPSSIDRKSVV